MHRRCLRVVLITAFMTLSPTILHADAGLPMIGLTVPYMGIALIGIIPIEAVIIGRRLNLSTSRLIPPVSLANIVTTFIGCPLAWFVFLMIELVTTGGGKAYGVDTFGQRLFAVTWQASWLIPYESQLGWMVPIAMIVLLIPFLGISVFLEYWIYRRMLREAEKQLLKIGVIHANVLTYLLLAVLPLVNLIAYLKSGSWLWPRL